MNVPRTAGVRAASPQSRVVPGCGVEPRGVEDVVGMFERWHLRRWQRRGRKTARRLRGGRGPVTVHASGSGAVIAAGEVHGNLTITHHQVVGDGAIPRQRGASPGESGQSGR